MEEELLYRNHFFTDGQTNGQTDRETAMVKPVYLHNFVGGGIQTYFQCGEIVEKLPPLRSNFHGGSHFFTTCGSKFNVKIWNVSAFNVEKLPGESLLTLKNDPGSHFSTGSLFNVTPALFTCYWYLHYGHSNSVSIYKDSAFRQILSWFKQYYMYLKWCHHV